MACIWSDQSRQPLAGSLVRVEPGVHGVPAEVFAG